MTNINKINITTNSLLHLIMILTLHIIIFLFVAYILLIILSIILINGFELLYTLWTQWFSIFIPISILISSMLVILLSNPVYALIALILVFLNTAIFLMSIQVKFLAFIYLIVYIGAIAILFLFVIMLFNLRNLDKTNFKIKDFRFLTINFKFYLFFGLKFFSLITIDILNLIDYNTYLNTTILDKQFDLQYFLTYVHWDILLFSNLFYTYYIYLFLLSGMILLVAMVGSIVLALSINEPHITKKWTNEI